LFRESDWIRGLPKKKRGEALILRNWSLSTHFESLCDQFELDHFDYGEVPDSVLTGVGNRIAVEVTRIVSPKKAIYDNSNHHPEGGYTSTLRASKPSREFHKTIEAGGPPDASKVRPHFEPSSALERDYKTLATERLTDKAKSVSKYANQYSHVILLSDEMSEFTDTLKRRLPMLVTIPDSILFPANSEVILVCESESFSSERQHITKLRCFPSGARLTDTLTFDDAESI
jgi:hypothetical protein